MLRNYINGEWVNSLGTDSVEVTNPATGEFLEKCPLSTSKDVDAAVVSARLAFKEWRKTPVIDRVQPLFKLKSLMEENFNELATTITLEHGKTLIEAKGSVRRAIQMVETATSMPSLMMGQVSEDIAPGIDSVAIHQPMGVFAAVCPFNFPAMVPFWFWPFAVASGNTFVIKPSERVPMTQIKIFDLIEKAGFPKGVMNLVHGGKDVVNAICDHDQIRGVSFVGSTPVAKHVYQRATAKGKRVQSLGGAKNLMVILPDAVMDKAVNTSLESIIGCAGERCLAGSIVVSVGSKTYEDVKSRMVQAASDISVGDGLDPNVQMGPVISQNSKDRILGLIERAIAQGAELLVDGRDVSQLDERLKNGYFIRPVVLGGITPDMEIAKEEVFGPVVLLAQVDSYDTALHWINNSDFGNTSSLFTSSGAAARKFIYETEPSMVGVNIGVPAPMSFFSFGGSKDSFFGDIKAHGSASVQFYTDTKVAIQRWDQSCESTIWAQD